MSEPPTRAGSGPPATCRGIGIRWPVATERRLAAIEVASVVLTLLFVLVLVSALLEISGLHFG